MCLPHPCGPLCWDLACLPTHTVLLPRQQPPAHTCLPFNWPKLVIQDITWTLLACSPSPLAFLHAPLPTVGSSVSHATRLPTALPRCGSLLPSSYPSTTVLAHPIAQQLYYEYASYHITDGPFLAISNMCHNRFVLDIYYYYGSAMCCAIPYPRGLGYMPFPCLMPEQKKLSLDGKKRGRRRMAKERRRKEGK